MVPALMVWAVASAAAPTEVTPWGGAPVRGTVERVDPCGVSIKLDGGSATVALAWPEIRSISPVDPAWKPWIDAGDAVRRGEQRLARGDAALAADAFAQATALLEGAKGPCLGPIWSSWAQALEASGRGSAAVLARLQALDRSASDAPEAWPTDLCPAFARLVGALVGGPARTAGSGMVRLAARGHRTAGRRGACAAAQATPRRQQGRDHAA